MPDYADCRLNIDGSEEFRRVMNTFKKYRILVILNLSFARKDKKGLSLSTVVFKFVISHTSVSLYSIITTIYCHRNRLLETHLETHHRQ